MGMRMIRHSMAFLAHAKYVDGDSQKYVGGD